MSGFSQLPITSLPAPGGASGGSRRCRRRNHLGLEVEGEEGLGNRKSSRAKGKYDDDGDEDTEKN
eukprot:1560089-Pyramimonas_sp.AAC.1